jgi:hypothetical protein
MSRPNRCGSSTANPGRTGTAGHRSRPGSRARPRRGRGTPETSGGFPQLAQGWTAKPAVSGRFADIPQPVPGGWAVSPRESFGAKRSRAVAMGVGKGSRVRGGFRNTETPGFATESGVARGFSGHRRGGRLAPSPGPPPGLNSTAAQGCGNCFYRFEGAPGGSVRASGPTVQTQIPPRRAVVSQGAGDSR